MCALRICCLRFLLNSGESTSNTDDEEMIFVLNPELFWICWNMLLILKASNISKTRIGVILSNLKQQLQMATGETCHWVSHKLKVIFVRLK
jgi:hypothetical protein